MSMEGVGFKPATEGTDYNNYCHHEISCKCQWIGSERHVPAEYMRCCYLQDIRSNAAKCSRAVIHRW